jgi:hypothetical protein
MILSLLYDFLSILASQLFRQFNGLIAGAAADTESEKTITTLVVLIQLMTQYQFHCDNNKFFVRSYDQTYNTLTNLLQ